MQTMQNHLEKLSKKIKTKWVQSTCSLSWDGRSVFATGDSPSVAERHAIGVFLVKNCKKKAGYKGLVNTMTVNGKKEKPMSIPTLTDTRYNGKKFDVIIIGAGIIGCTIARELSRYELSIAVLEKECDCCMHASARNDGMIHPGFAASPKSKKAQFNARGNALYHSLSKELNFDALWTGSFLLFSRRILRLLVPYMRWRAKKNNIAGNFGYRSKKHIRKTDPYISAKHYGGFWMPSSGTVSPFKVTLAFAENAAQNNVKFFFETAVTSFNMKNKKISEVHTNRGVLHSTIIINAAGVWADKVAEFANDRFFSIHPRKGMDIILDKKKYKFQNAIVGMPDLFSTSKNHSKGGGIIPCVEGNILVGPTAREVYDREDYSTSTDDMQKLFTQMSMNEKLLKSDVIAYYSGIRAANWEEDFIIEGSEKVENLIHCAAIQSPGFASAPAIAEEIAKISTKRLAQLTGIAPTKKSHFIKSGTAPIEMTALTVQDQQTAINNNPAYGNIICRCEQISEGEICAAIQRCKLLGMETISLDAIKRRCRAGAGRCHGGFCTPRVMEIMARELTIPLQTITKKGNNSFIVSEPMILPQGEVRHAT